MTEFPSSVSRAVGLLSLVVFSHCTISQKWLTERLFSLFFFFFLTMNYFECGCQHTYEGVESSSFRKSQEIERIKDRQGDKNKKRYRALSPACLTQGVLMEPVSHVMFVLAFKAASCSHLVHYACSRTLLDRQRGSKCDSMSSCDSVSSPQAHFCMLRFLMGAAFLSGIRVHFWC